MNMNTNELLFAKDTHFNGYHPTKKNDDHQKTKIFNIVRNEKTLD